MVDASSDDEELVARVAGGDELAFRLLYDRHADLVYSVALRVLGDEAGAEDVAQDVFLRLWRSPRSFDPERGRFMGWVLTVARNRALDAVRARTRRRAQALPPPDSAEEPSDRSSGDPAWHAVLAADQQRVRSAVGSLPSEQREAIELAFFSGLTQQEIADRTAAPLGTVKTRIRLGMRKLRTALDLDSESMSVR